MVDSDYCTFSVLTQVLIDQGWPDFSEKELNFSEVLPILNTLLDNNQSQCNEQRRQILVLFVFMRYSVMTN